MKGQNGNADATKSAKGNNTALDALDAYANDGDPVSTAPEDIFDGVPVETFEEVVAEEPPPPDPIIDGLFEAAEKIEAIGPSKVRKSWFVLALVIHIAAGIDFCGFRIPKPRKVCYINLELTPRWLTRRLRALKKAYGITDEMINGRLIVVNGRGYGGVVRDRLAAFPSGTGIDLVVVDPRYKLNTKDQDDNSSADLASLLATFDHVTSQGPAVMVVAHDGKGQAGDRDIRDRGAGSSVAGRDCDARITLTPHREDPKNMLVVETLARNFAAMDPFSVVFDSRQRKFRHIDSLPLVVTTASTMKSAAATDKQLEDSIELVVKRKGSPTTKELVASVGAATGFHERRIREALSRMEQKGSVRGVIAGVGAFSPKRWTVCTAAPSSSPLEGGSNA